MAEPLGVPEGGVAAPPWQLTPHAPDLSPAELAGFIGLFAPVADTPDYVLTWREQQAGPQRWVTSTVRRHGSWVRTDTIDSPGTDTRSVHVPTGVVVSTGRNEDGTIRYFEVRAPEHSAPRSGGEGNGRLTGQTASFAAEPCRWWDVYHSPGDGPPLSRQQACVTEDGIQISTRTLGQDDQPRLYSSAFITHLTRQPVGPDEVKPVLPNRNDWIEETRTGRASRDNFTVRLSAGTGHVLIVRRRGDWLGEQEWRNGALSISAHDSDGRSVLARVDTGGRPTLLTYRHQRSIDLAQVPMDDPPETVLGLRCLWVDVMPHFQDTGRVECQTSDGVPLKIMLISRGRGIELVAEHLDRASGSVHDLMPPSSLMDLATWGASR